MALELHGKSIRYNGTGKIFARREGESLWRLLGESESLELEVALETEKLYTADDASKGVILESETSREATLSLAPRQWDEQTLLLAMLGQAFVSEAQLAGTHAASPLAVALGGYVELAHNFPRLVRLRHGAPSTGAIARGSTVTQTAPQAASGVVAWAGEGYLDLIQATGVFTAGATLTESGSGRTAPITGVETRQDVCATKPAPDPARYVLGQDYYLEPHAGLLQSLVEGVTTMDVAYDHPAVDRRTAEMLKGATWQGTLRLVTDPDDVGDLYVVTFHRATLGLSGSVPLKGAGVAALPLKGAVLRTDAGTYYAITRVEVPAHA